MRPLQEKIVIEQKSLVFQASRSMLYFDCAAARSKVELRPQARRGARSLGCLHPAEGP
jgi:hypothetical protein